MRRLALPVLLMLIVLSLCPAQVQANGGSVGVLNVPPSFNDIDIGEENGKYRIDLMLSDTNGRADIATVEVEILDSAENMIAAFNYSQFNSHGNLTVDEFKNIKGNWLDKGKSSVERYNNGNIYLKRCVLNLTFFFTPGDGDYIKVTVTDIHNETATGKVPYAMEGVAIPVPLRNPAATVSISTMIALAVTLFVLRGRFSSDKLAMSIAKKWRKKKRKETLDELMERLG